MGTKIKDKSVSSISTMELQTAKYLGKNKIKAVKELAKRGVK